jgi:hypothetical protein
VGDAEGVEHDPRHVPEKLRTDHLAVRCLVKELVGDDVCDGWTESFEIEKTGVKVDGYGNLYFPDNVPTECPNCHDRVLAYNGVEVTFHG